MKLKVMLQETIRNDDFKRNAALQRCSYIVSNCYNIVPTLQPCVALEIVVANRPVYNHLKEVPHSHKVTTYAMAKRKPKEV